MTSHTFERQGVRLRWGQNEGSPAFVFQHGLGGDMTQTFDALLPEAMQRVLTLECRGHGESELGNEQQLSFRTFADDLIALMDQQAIERVPMGGISMGAGVTLNLALRYPERVSALVLVRPAWLNRPMEIQGWFAEVARLIRENGPSAGHKRFIDSAIYRSISAESPGAALALASQFLSPRAAQCVARLEKMPHSSPFEEMGVLKNIRVPTLVLAHTEDPIHPYDYGVQLAEAIGGAKLVRVIPKYPDAERHISEVKKAVLDFLGQLG